MGGWHAFPGGRLSSSDVAAPVHGVVDGADAYALSGQPAAHTACAFRELFEEAGILAVTGELPDKAERDRARNLLLAEELDFADWLERRGLMLDVARLSFAGRWVTPQLSPIRFDASFFLLEWQRDEIQQPEVIPGELSEGEWIAASAALQRWEDGDVLLAQPTLATLRVLAEHGPAGRARLWQSEAHQPNSPRVIEFRPSIRVIPLKTRTLPPATHTNALLLGSVDMALVDPGTADEGELRRLREIVDAELGRSGGRLRGIWVTHHHDDHVAGVEALRRHYGVPVSAHSLTATRLSARGIQVNRHLDGGERLDLGGSPPMRIRVMHTPGHASGHLCFFEERTRTLLCGDMLSGYGTVSINPPDGSMSDYIDSLASLEALDAQVILPGHGSMIPNASRALADAREHRLWREERVLAAWDSGERDPEAMLPAVYGKLDTALQPFAARQVLAHLERLEETGRTPRLPEVIHAALGRC